MLVDTEILVLVVLLVISFGEPFMVVCDSLTVAMLGKAACNGLLKFDISVVWGVMEAPAVIPVIGFRGLRGDIELNVEDG